MSTVAVKCSLNDLQKETAPVIVFGAGVVGEVVLHFCRKKQIEIAALCENDSKKSGKVIMGKEVMSLSEVKHHFPGAIFIISIIDISDIVSQLEDAGFHSCYVISSLLKDFPVYDYQYSRNSDFVNHVLSNCIISHNSFFDPDKLFLRSVDLVVTQRCSLRCRDCSNLMQYYTAPYDYKADKLIKEISLLCRTADFINEIRIIGGEPFMNRESLGIAAELTHFDNVGKVVFFTNGTIVPDFSAFDGGNKQKLLFVITDYGNLSRQLSRLVDALTCENINCIVSPAGNWTNCSAIRKYDRSAEEIQNDFDCCCAKNLFTLMDGKLFRCPYAANCYSLGLPEQNAADYVTIEDRADLLPELMRFIHRRKVFPVCSWCPGRHFNDPEITPAIQCRKPLPLPW